MNDCFYAITAELHNFHMSPEQTLFLELQSDTQLSWELEG